MTDRLSPLLALATSAALPALLTGCVLRAPEPGSETIDSAVDTDGGGDVGEEDASELGFARVLTANAALTGGVLESVNLNTGAINEDLAETSGDAQLAIVGESLLVLDRFDDARVRLLDPGEWETPLADYALDGAPYDAQVCGDALFVSLHTAGTIVALDPLTGETLASIEAPKGQDPAGLAVVEGTLYAALHELDPATYTPLAGSVAEIDCETRKVVRTIGVPGPLPAVEPWPGEPDKLLVRVGAFDRQGGLYAVDRPSGLVSLLIDEAAMDRGLADVALSGRRGVALTYDADWRYGVSCFDTLDFLLVEVEQPRAQLVDVALSPEGRAWIAARPPADDPSGLSGLLVYDLETCTSITGADWFRLDQPPWRIIMQDLDDETEGE